MRRYRALMSKHLHESRWTLMISAAVLFALGWLSVYMTSLNETQIMKGLASGEEGSGRLAMMRSMGVQMTSVSIMMAFWNHPFFLLLVSIWGIGRGSGAVGAEIERGTLDMILSRPVSRFEYLFSQVAVAIGGLMALSASLTLGAGLALRYNFLHEPPSLWSFVKPAINLGALGLPMYGYSLLASSADSVRWRPTWIGSVLTLAGFIAFVMASIAVFKDEWWKPWLERVSIFKRYNPVELVAKAETFESSMAVLVGAGACCIVLAFVVFLNRDLPANG